MVPESRLFCSLDGLSSKVRAQARSCVLQDLGLLETVAVPVFEEVVQTAAHFTGMAMALLTVVTESLVPTRRFPPVTHGEVTEVFGR